MKRQFSLLLVITFLSIICNSLIYAQGIKPPRIANLGNIHGKKVVCRISLVTIDKDLDQYEVHLEFQARDKAGRTRALGVDAGVCFGSDPKTFDISVDDYIGLGHKQVFVMASYGDTTSRLYDCDGHSVHTLYSRDGGHFRSWLVRGRDGHWRMIEEWRSDDFLDSEDENLGGATVFEKPSKIGFGILHRMLHWNEHGFVPDYPGAARILNRKV